MITPEMPEGFWPDKVTCTGAWKAPDGKEYALMFEVKPEQTQEEIKKSLYALVFSLWHAAHQETDPGKAA